MQQQLPTPEQRDRPLASRNTMFWKPDAGLDAAKKHPGWTEFHRACGRAGLYFDDIEPAGRGDYTALTFRLDRKSADLYLRFRVATGRGRGPIGAVLSAFQASLDAGWPVDPALAALLSDEPVAADDDLMELLGDPPAVVIEDWELA